mmetsp:Transcript_47370/g.101418  ORF Transcript_47370/g.101418 Transcript_47370/m.101418 type:complete len:272 (-) Transcript_47370:187-1002(-)|eukprot:CAMPEP_0180471722 /NCGR_PEP_ID=MMETSP1036_2-20121128/29264_1 /TAXON_ID=632150 /ORGANISM="Azadinium spinosum, Strain 3D9" /LENGTH=271 /DNA_ID=CAMNT_0022478929 /DNA_START=28 /DNA_END=843 /DNA_ORIENTATION=+
MAAGFVEFLSQDEVDTALSLTPDDVEQAPGTDDARMQTRLLVECAQCQEQLKQLLAGLHVFQQSGMAFSLPTDAVEQAPVTDDAGTQTRLFLECTQRQEQLQQLIVGLDDKVSKVSAVQERLEAQIIQRGADRVGAAQWVFVPPPDKSPTPAEEKRLAEEKLREEKKDREEVDRFQKLHVLAFCAERDRYLDNDEEEDEEQIASRAERLRMQRQKELEKAGLKARTEAPIRPNWVKKRWKLSSPTGLSMEDIILRCENIDWPGESKFSQHV